MYSVGQLPTFHPQDLYSSVPKDISCPVKTPSVQSHLWRNKDMLSASSQVNLTSDQGEQPPALVCVTAGQ